MEVILLVQRRRWEKRAAAPLLLLVQWDAVCLVLFQSTASCPGRAAEEAVSWLRARLKDGWTSRDFNYGRNPAPVWAARCQPVTSPSRGTCFTSSYCNTSTVSLMPSCASCFSAGVHIQSDSVRLCFLSPVSDQRQLRNFIFSCFLLFRTVRRAAL